jgi:hypothetical protein
VVSPLSVDSSCPEWEGDEPLDDELLRDEPLADELLQHIFRRDVSSVLDKRFSCTVRSAAAIACLSQSAHWLVIWLLLTCVLLYTG